MRFRTQQIHAGVEPDPSTGAILTPIHQTTTFVQPSVEDYMSKGYSYSRTGNPTVRAWETARGTECRYRTADRVAGCIPHRRVRENES